MGRTGPALLLATSLVTLAAACDDKRPAPPPASKPTTTTAPATTQAAEPERPLVELLDILRREDPDYPTTQPLRETLDASAAARVRLREPTFLCSRGDLWITRDDAPPTPEALKLAPKRQTHVTRETVRFVYWRPGTTPWTPELIAEDHEAASTRPDASPPAVWIAGDKRVPFDRSLDRDWSRAREWNTPTSQAVIVPTSTGVSVIRLANGRLDERHVRLLDSPATGTSTQFAFDVRGLLAWSVGGDDGSRVARFVDGNWTMLTPASAWPASLVHVLPFLDGSVLTIADHDGALALRSTPVDTVAIDENRVRGLVAQLADRLPENRERAQAELAAIGPAAWPLLERLVEGQRAEARIRIRAILGNQTTPTLGGIAPQPGPSRLVTRLRDGGVVLYFEAGASAVDATGVVRTSAPAWLAVRPSGPVRALPGTLTGKLDPRHVTLKAWGDDWIVEHDVDGPMRWMGNHFEPLVRPAERGEFKRFVGLDSMGRWVFQTLDPRGPTLVVDVTLPDPRPKFPTWTQTARRAGWTDDDWPAMASGGAWVLKDGAWAVMKGDIEPQLHTTLTPTTAPTALLTDSAGNVYEDGMQAIAVRKPDGTTLRWPLPPEATGPGVIDGNAVLIEAADRLFLCNAPGRVIRLRRQFDKAEPFKLDGTFSRGIPATDVRRIWKDPAERICFASEGNKLSIAFPTGRIEGEMANMIPAAALRDALRGEDEPTERGPR